MNYTQSKTSHPQYYSIFHALHYSTHFLNSHHTSTSSSNTTTRDSSYLNNLATHTHLFPTHKSRASLSPPITGFTELRRICLSISFIVTLYVYRNEIRSFLTFVAVPAAAHSELVYNKFLTYVFLELWTNILNVVKNGASYISQLPVTGKVQFAGVNIAGFDFDCNINGTCNLSSTFDVASKGNGIAQMSHFTKNSGLNAFRLPVGWQFLLNNDQTPSGPIDATNLAAYDVLVQGCWIAGVRCASLMFTTMHVLME